MMGDDAGAMGRVICDERFLTFVSCGDPKGWSTTAYGPKCSESGYVGANCSVRVV